MQGSANSNIIENILKGVTSLRDERRKQTVASTVVYITISDIFLGTV